MKIFKKKLFNSLKLILVNKDDENAKFFLDASSVEKIKYSLEDISEIKESVHNHFSTLSDD